ncbi:hypothetical protein AV654_28575 [Paenibacillus elgii]|uniref:Uncharacterized protein n=1 Tax=Paenibacillus elgii TaxID=189691 RepID=A0A165QGK3_9BACL|nr:hypothetical protein AV654_28575 [Paenibacillus elgii]PUA37229.1 hypothetical protein C8Z91_21230 [Paenibacillus elgii]
MWIRTKKVARKTWEYVGMICRKIWKILNSPFVVAVIRFLSMFFGSGAGSLEKVVSVKCFVPVVLRNLKQGD